MKSHIPARYALLVAASLLALLAVFAIWPSGAHAAIPEPALPGWLHDVLVQIEIAMVKTLQDTARVGGVLLWGILKVCGMVGLFGNDFSILFGTVVTEALNAVITGQVHTLIRGSLMVSLGLFGLSLLARPFWPDLKLVSFQRAAIWGIVIQAYLLNAPAIYTELETWRVDLSEQVADAVSTGAVPGCSGNVVQVLLCITGTSSAEVLEPRLPVLPDHLPYGGAESVRDLYDHCAYNPPVLYASPACDQDSPTGDPWQVLVFAQDALGIQLLSLIVGLLILAYGILQISLGLAAGMMFVLFPVAAIFAFYLPLESFPAGVIRNYISIFLKSVVLLTLAGVVIRLFSIATGSLAAMAAVALVDLLLCLVMAKEALASLLGSIGFIGSSVGSLGAAIGLGGAAGAAMAPSSESRVAASMIGGGAVAQTLMGAAHPYGGSQGRTVLGTTGAVAGAPGRGARSALSAAMAAGTGGAGAVVGMVAAARATGSSTQGSGLGSLALMGNAATTILGRNAGRGFMTGAGVVAARKVRKQGQTAVATAASPATQPSTPLAQSSTMRPASAGAATSMPTGKRTMIPADPVAGVPVSTVPLQDMLLGNSTTDLSGWSPASARRIRQTAVRLEPASPDAENAVLDLAMAGHRQAQWWDHEGRSPVLADGSLSPSFVEEVVQLQPDATETLGDEMAVDNIPSDQRLGAGEAVALGVTTQRSIPAQQVQQGFGRAVEAMEHERDLGAAMQTALGVSPRDVFGQRAPQANRVARQMVQAGLANSLGRQLVETVGENVQRNPHLTAQQLREASAGDIAQWDQATGNAETTNRIVDGLIGLGPASPVTVREIPQPPRAARTQRTAQPRPETPEPARTSTRAESGAQALSVPDPVLAASLREWRLAEAQQEGRKAFYVFSDATLQRIADARPQTLEELEAVKGIGPKKLAQYGQDVLAITRTEAEVKGETG